MYLVQLAPGMERIYRDDGEFTTAIMLGEVNGESKIYHRNSSQWLPVTCHPRFRQATEARSVESMGPPPRREWTFFRAEAAEAEGIAPPATATAGTSASAGDGAPAPARNWRKMLGGLIRHH